MEEFEPKKKVKIFTKEFIAKYAYIFIIALVLLGGFSYGLTFYVQNKKIASGSITTANLTINFTDRTINASNLSVPADNQEGMTEYSKSVTVTNQTAIDGRVKLTLTRTSGLNLTDMSYALVVNGAIQEIGDVPASGEIIETALMGNESIDVEVRLWPKTTYTGSTTTFVGELTPEIKYLGPVASSRIDLVGKYVDFNCNGSTCEQWQVVKVEDGRLVLTRQADYSGATSRTNSNRYNPDSFNPALTFNDDSLITSLSTDGKNVYLLETVKITGGSGTQADPYTLGNSDFRESDKKVLAVITYKQDSTTLGTQNVYYGETNYISREAPSTYAGWSDGTNSYFYGDVINSITTDTNLTAMKVNAENLSFINTTTSFVCTDAQCALEELNNLVDPPPPTAAQTIGALLTETNAAGNKIYTGSDPDNYVWFNNEQWRIIGVYGNNIKIIKATPSTTSQNWQNSTDDGNTWSGSLMQSTYLYNTYWPTLSAIAQNMIEQSATWNVGACGYDIAAQAAYTCASSTTWTGKIGLIASYEYLYAAENDGTCWTTSGSDYDGGCYQKDWLYSTVTNSGSSPGWALSPSSEDSNCALLVRSDGFVGNYYVNYDFVAASPVVFLKSTITITGGNGKVGETNSYKLG